MNAPTTFSPAVDLELVDDGQIAILTLVDKARANAMSPEMADAFRSRVDELQASQKLRAVIVRGDGKDFSIGGARQMLTHLTDPKLTPEERHTFMLGFYNRWLSILDIPVPVIAAIQGECIGVAPIFACAADIAIAEDTATFNVTFANLGFYPGMAMSYLLPRAINRQAANLMLLGSRAFSGRHAADVGLVARSVPPGRLMQEALTLAREIAANGPNTTRDLTVALRVSREQLRPALEADAARQAKSYASEEFRERIAVYLPDHYDAA